LGLKDHRSNQKTNRRKKHIKNTRGAIEKHIQAEGGVSRLTSNRIKSIKDMKLINLYLIIIKYLSPENIDLQEFILFYYLKHIF
jgi:hypothetical protein